jgi:hypothetical protein
MRISTLAKGFTHDARYMTGNYSTKQYPCGGGDCTPIETYNYRIVVHMGSGVATSGSFYYNSNQNGITRSDSLRLVNTNFDLNSRLPITTSSLTTSSSNTGSSTTQTVSTPSTSPGPSGIPELPAQLGFTLLATAVIATSYVLARRVNIPRF